MGWKRECESGPIVGITWMRIKCHNQSLFYFFLLVQRQLSYNQSVRTFRTKFAVSCGWSRNHRFTEGASSTETTFNVTRLQGHARPASITQIHLVRKVDHISRRDVRKISVRALKSCDVTLLRFHSHGWYGKSNVFRDILISGFSKV